MRRHLGMGTGVVLLTALGFLVRLAHLLANRSLFIDEARLALNVGTRTFSGLLRPLALEQVAPIPFLLAEKLMAEVFGMGEVALRLVPFACGVALLGLSWALARRVLSPKFALLVLAWTAVSPTLVRESNNLKQYGWDAVVAVVVMLLAVDALHDPMRHRLRRLVFAAPVACLCSMTAIFVVLPALLALGLTAWERRDHAAGRLLAWACLGAGFATWLPYLANYRAVAASDYMRSFWRGAFLSPTPFATASNNALIASDGVWNVVLGGLPAARGDVLMAVAMYALTTAVIALSVAGTVALYRERRRVAIIVAVPLALIIAASLIGAYPLRARLETFAVVPFMVLVVAGAQWLATRLGERVIVGIIGALLVPGAVVVSVPRLWPYVWEELRPLVSAIRASPADEPVYIYANAAPAWLYYTTDWASPDRGRLAHVMALIGYGSPAFENAFALAAPSNDVNLSSSWDGRTEYYGRSSGVPWRPYIDWMSLPMHQVWVEHEALRVVAGAQPYIWVVFTHYRGTENALLDQLEDNGMTQWRALKERGSAAFLYLRAARLGLTCKSHGSAR